MVRHTLVALAMVCVGLVTVASGGQAGVPGPKLEIGADLSLRPSVGAEHALTPVAPRVILNLSPRTALAFTGEGGANREVYENGWAESRLAFIEARRALRQAGRHALTGFVGLGLHRTRVWQPESTAVDDPNERVYTPARDVTSTKPAMALGLTLSYRLGPVTSLRGDLRFLFGDGLGELSPQIGLSVPLGRYPSQPVTRSASYGTTLLRTGQHVWITAGDNEVEGVVGHVSDDRLELVVGSGRISMSRTEIHRVRVPDVLGDGMRRGALIGGAAVAGLMALAATVFCEDTDDCRTAGVVVPAGFGYGAAVGALAGAILDSAFERPVVTFDRNAPSASVTLTPLARPSRIGALARLSW